MRKLIGYGYIAGEHAEAIGKFRGAALKSVSELHRPCGFATVSPDSAANADAITRPKIMDAVGKLKSLSRPSNIQAGSSGGAGTKGWR